MLKKKKIRYARPSRKGLSRSAFLRHEQLEDRNLLTMLTSHSSMGDIPFDIPEGDFDKADALYLPGSSSFVMRDEEGIHAGIETNSLDPGVYTFWIGVFNDPEFCWAACFTDDLHNEQVRPSVVWGGGAIVGDDGTAKFEASLKEGRIEDPSILVDPDADWGLIDSFKADIHLVLRYHGPPDENELVREQQLGTFKGGCDIYECRNDQFAIHDPPFVDFTVRPITTMDDVEIASAYSRLTRFDDRIVMTAVAKELQAGSYTAWAAIHNDPRACGTSCSLENLEESMRDETTSLVFLGGHFNEHGDNRVFDFAINESDIFQAEFGPGLTEPRAAEIQFFLRYHGPDNIIFDSYDGGCDQFECLNTQISNHKPLIPGDSNLDNRFDSSDLVEVFRAGKYETEDSATFEEGDWNRDGFFNSSDLVFAFERGYYSFAARPISKVSTDLIFAAQTEEDDLKREQKNRLWLLQNDA